MFNRKIAKQIITIAVGVGTGYVIGSILKNNVTADTIPQKVKAQVGGYILGAMVAEKVNSWTDSKVDGLFNWWDKTKNEFPDAEELANDPTK